MDKLGFVPLTIRSEEVNAPKGASARYQALTAGAFRLSTNFRFRSGGSELDNRALRDLDRVADFMSKARVGPDHLIVLGFADSEATVHIVRDFGATSTVRTNAVNRKLD